MKSKYSVIGFIVLFILTLSVNVHAKEKLMVFCGAAFNRPMEEIIQAFTAKTEVEVNVTYGGVSTLLSQIMLTKRGDVFVVPSSYVTEQAKSKGWKPDWKDRVLPKDQPTGITPKCGIHGTEMNWRTGVSKKTGKPYAFWSCPSKNADGSWCNFTPPKEVK